MTQQLFWFFIGGCIFLLVIYIIKKIQKIFPKYEKQLKATSFKCLDGHIVRSKAELIIDNLLSRLGIKHIYEKEIKVRGKIIKYDFFLPDFEIYIEFWGLFSKN